MANSFSTVKFKLTFAYYLHSFSSLVCVIKRLHFKPKLKTCLLWIRTNVMKTSLRNSGLSALPPFLVAALLAWNILNGICKVELKTV